MTLNAWNGLPDPKIPMTTQTEKAKMNQDKQPEALRLAGAIEKGVPTPTKAEVAAELRRLHAESEQHLQELRSYRITVENREVRIAELEAQLVAVQQGEPQKGDHVWQLDVDNEPDGVFYDPLIHKHLFESGEIIATREQALDAAQAKQGGV